MITDLVEFIIILGVNILLQRINQNITFQVIHNFHKGSAKRSNYKINSPQVDSTHTQSPSFSSGGAAAALRCAGATV